MFILLCRRHGLIRCDDFTIIYNCSIVLVSRNNQIKFKNKDYYLLQSAITYLKWIPYPSLISLPKGERKQLKKENKFKLNWSYQKNKTKCILIKCLQFVLAQKVEIPDKL